MQTHTVRGSYLYYHYLQDRIDDKVCVTTLTQTEHR
jgi:hypothetical protein